MKATQKENVESGKILRLRNNIVEMGGGVGVLGREVGLDRGKGLGREMKEPSREQTRSCVGSIS